MNRSYSHSWRSKKSSQKANSLFGKTATTGFRTVWKFRDNHQIKTKDKPNANLIKEISAQTQQQNTCKAYETAAQQQMKQFIKMMKKNSDQPAKISKVPLQQSRHIRTSQSTVSNRSLLKSRCESKLTADCGQPTSSLDQLQAKIQNLIKQKLSKKSSSRPFFGASAFEDGLEIELKSLIKQVRKCQNKYNFMSCQNDVESQPNADASIKQINKKIGIYQKLIAQSYTESQMLKKYYSSTRKIRKNFAVLDKSLRSKQKLSFTKNLSQSSLSQSKPFIHYETTNMSCFIKPQRSSYVTESAKRGNYLMNRQPIPRSNYQRQFLYLGSIPINNYRFGDHFNENPLKMSSNFSIAENKPSVYQAEFTEKKANLIDSKTLDCRQDKLKNLKINFMPTKSKQLKNHKNKENQNSQQTKIRKKTKNDNFQQQVIRKSIANKRQNTRFSQMNISNNVTKDNAVHISQHFNGRTEHQHQYVGNKPTLETLIKQKNLNNLKYFYKIQYNA